MIMVDYFYDGCGDYLNNHDMINDRVNIEIIKYVSDDAENYYIDGPLTNIYPLCKKIKCQLCKKIMYILPKKMSTLPKKCLLCQKNVHFTKKCRHSLM